MAEAISGRCNQQLAHTSGCGLLFYIEYFIEISEKSRYNISVIEIFMGGSYDCNSLFVSMGFECLF